MEWLLLSLMCAVSVASADALTKYALHMHSLTQLVFLRFALTALVCTPLWWLQRIDHVPVQFWGWLALIIPAELAAAYLYVKAIQKSPLSLTLPYLAFTPILVILPAYVLLGETLTFAGIVGIVLVVFGAFSLQAGAERDLVSRITAPLKEAGSGLMLVVAALYAVTTVGAKSALQWVPAAFFLPLYFWILTALSLIFLLPRSSASLRGAGVTKWHGLLALTLGVATISHFVGIQLVEVAYFLALKRTSLLFGIGYGVLMFKEGQPARRIVAGLVIITGVFLVSVQGTAAGTG